MARCGPAPFSPGPPRTPCTPGSTPPPTGPADGSPWRRASAGGEEGPDRVRGLPRRHRKKSRSTDPPERLDRELERRTDVIRVFPHPAALERSSSPVERCGCSSTRRARHRGSRSAALGRR
ncbi:transposase [Streptomyces sp. enrichment culture]|uniref:transposase n=1 Tax=Streptomyces sp. enrichment culture TaxID=1795815 RepID=UPI003F573B7D